VRLVTNFILNYDEGQQIYQLLDNSMMMVVMMTTNWNTKNSALFPYLLTRVTAVCRTVAHLDKYWQREMEVPQAHFQIKPA